MYCKTGICQILTTPDLGREFIHDFSASLLFSFQTFYDEQAITMKIQKNK